MASHKASLKCTKFDFRWGSDPDPAGELPAGLERPTSNGREGKGGEVRRAEREKGERKE